MHDAARYRALRGGQRATQIHGDGGDHRGAQDAPTASQRTRQHAQIYPAHELEHEEHVTVFVLHAVEQLHDVGVADAGQKARLFQQRAPSVTAEVVVRALDAHVLREQAAHTPGQPRLGSAAAPERTQQREAIPTRAWNDVCHSPRSAGRRRRFRAFCRGSRLW